MNNVSSFEFSRKKKQNSFTLKMIIIFYYTIRVNNTLQVLAHFPLKKTVKKKKRTFKQKKTNEVKKYE